jgi:hypothetical protein
MSSCTFSSASKEGAPVAPSTHCSMLLYLSLLCFAGQYVVVAAIWSGFLRPASPILTDNQINHCKRTRLLHIRFVQCVTHFACAQEHVSEYAPTVVSFPVQRVRDLEQGCAGLFERGMLPVTRLLDSLG